MFRRTEAAWEANKGEGNRLALKALVDGGRVPGILTYADGEPAGWCSISPREAYPVLDRSRVLARVDDRPVWSAVCFFVAREHRRQGLTTKLLQAAVDYAREHDASVVEGYPVVPKQGDVPAAFAWPGLASAFVKAGFTEVLRRSETRPIMRLYLPESNPE